MNKDMLSNEKIAELMLSDIQAYKENIKEIIVGRLMDSSCQRTYWDAWFRGAKGKDLEAADKGVVYKKKKVLLVIGNVSFDHFEEDELSLFKTNKERKALVHEINCIVECESEEQAEELGEEALCVCCDSYLIPQVFEEPGNAEVVYECENNTLPIDVESFRKEFLS